MRRNGFTLIEVLTASALLAVATGIIWQTWLTANESAEVIEQKAAAAAEAGRALSVIAHELRGASLGSVSLLPAAQIEYRVAEDLEGNGLAVDKTGALELGAARTIGRDAEDRNADGLRERQLVLVAGGTIQVLANDLLTNEDANGNGVLDSGEDANSNGRLERGVWFESSGQGVRMIIETTGKTRRGHVTPVSFQQLVRPRNP
ncbi:MAG: prepilin-type N-terminal cleavage/methylation domain-containing protein [Candidatus Hydrogenedentes bacterium]|nr:prepilin-type N-terminal cleavage/methylation domain-containing protein [Candidatus Hydrogenedentota bacterium]